MQAAALQILNDGLCQYAHKSKNLDASALRLIMVRDIEYEILYCNSLSLVVIALWWLIHALTGAATKG